MIATTSGEVLPAAGFELAESPAIRNLLEWQVITRDFEELASEQDAPTTVWSGTLQPRFQKDADRRSLHPYRVVSGVDQLVLGFLGEFERAVDEREVAVGLGEVSEVTAGLEVEVLAVKAVAVRRR